MTLTSGCSLGSNAWEWSPSRAGPPSPALLSVSSPRSLLSTRDSHRLTDALLRRHRPGLLPPDLPEGRAHAVLGAYSFPEMC